METQHMTKLEVTIVRKGEGVTDRFTKAYSMQDHFDCLPQKDGQAFAKKKYGNEQVACQVKPLPQPEVESLIRHTLGLPDDSMLLAKVHNPTQSTFAGYYRKTISGVELLLKDVSAGTCYAVVNHGWMSELKDALKLATMGSVNWTLSPVGN